MRIKKYPDWQEAAENSKQRKAVSEPFKRLAHSKELNKTVVYNLEIVKPISGDPYFIYAKTGIRFNDKCTARDCDAVRWWKSY